MDSVLNLLISLAILHYWFENTWLIIFVYIVFNISNEMTNSLAVLPNSLYKSNLNHRFFFVHRYYKSILKNQPYFSKFFVESWFYSWSVIFFTSFSWSKFISSHWLNIFVFYPYKKFVLNKCEKTCTAEVYKILYLKNITLLCNR